MFDEEAIRTEGLLGIEATVRDAALQMERKARHGFFHSQLVAVLGAD